MLTYHADILCDGLNCHERLSLTDVDDFKTLEVKAYALAARNEWTHKGQANFCPECTRNPRRFLPPVGAVKVGAS